MRKMVIAILILALVLAACGSDEPTKGDITVYVTVPLSGFQANGGRRLSAAPNWRPPI